MIRTHSELDFFAIADNLSYKPDDEKESVMFRCESVVDCLHKANPVYAKYYTVEEESKVLAVIILQRDGRLSYFVTNDFTADKTRMVIRQVRKLADDTVATAGPVYVKTAKFYLEAIRFVKIVGFKPSGFGNKYIEWVYDHGW